MRLFTSLALLALVSCVGNPPGTKDYQPPPISAEAVVEAVPSADPVSRMGNKSPYEVFGQQYTVMPSADGYNEEGIASWYGMKFQGRRTSNGEVFDVYKATAAHKSLPLPSYLRVTNLENNASMIVRVNDRGPFVDDRLIDVSYGVAVKLGFAEQGTARVRLEHIAVDGKDDWRGTQESEYLQLQVGAFQLRSSAERIAVQIRDILGEGIDVLVSSVTHETGTIFRVRIGPVDSPEKLSEVQEVLLKNGLSKGQPLP
ncbi:MAG: septal ring lytic transglycosylase RlpA family protein [Gammaproteobacteria bacterium]|jgi:rare lipoprotein A|nr:septal ring lytic transglycosylase RlpA family protein [Gammaproteobacteria bacterium]